MRVHCFFRIKKYPKVNHRMVTIISPTFGAKKCFWVYIASGNLCYGYW